MNFIRMVNNYNCINELDNVIFHTDMKNKRILLIVPHQDDEINVLGDLLTTFQHNGAEVFVVFVTNGDYFISGTVRIHEAVKSLNVLGIFEKNIIFLGYPDTLNKPDSLHLYNALEKPITSHAGFIHTYGSEDYPDYAFSSMGQHHYYTRSNLCFDLKRLILDIKPDVIFCNDYDFHADHRMTSLCFERVMGDVLTRPNNDYHPIVFKAFAYCTGFHALNDFWEMNIVETQLPDKIRTLSYFGEDDMIDRFIYEWKNRVRFPIRKETCEKYFFNNPIYQALACHKSQRATLNFDRIVNSDKVFWQRRTDNLVCSAKITASSNQKEINRICDFLLYDANNINDMKPNIRADGWKPDDTDRDCQLCFEWDKPQIIKVIQVAIYKSNGNLPKLSYSTSKNSWVELDVLPNNGKYLTAVIKDEISVNKLRLRFIESKDFTVIDVGLYSKEYQFDDTLSVVKILLYDNFAYRYYTPMQEKEIPIRLYSYPRRSDINIVIYDDDGKKLHQFSANVEMKYNFIDSINKYFVQAEDNTGKVYDCISIERLNFRQFTYKKILIIYYKKCFIFFQYVLPRIKHLIKKILFSNIVRK